MAETFWKLGMAASTDHSRVLNSSIGKRVPGRKDVSDSLVANPIAAYGRCKACLRHKPGSQHRNAQPSSILIGSIQSKRP